MTRSPPAIHGQHDPRFAAVRERFAHNFVELAELGAALAVYVDGQLVVDLWGGLASRSDARAWQHDTLVNIYSSSKGLAALCVHRLVDQGLLELDAPVARYWSEFAAHGKAAIRVRDVLTHRAGLPALRAPLPHAALYDQATMARALAAEAPFWPSGERHGYHAQTFGFLLAELVLRVTGKTLGRYLRDEICEPLGADVHIGLAAEHDARVAKLTRPLGAAAPPGEVDMSLVFASEPQSVTALAFTNPQPSPGAVNTRAYRAAELPASNGHATAAGLARVYAALACGGAIDGVRVLSEQGVARCHEQGSIGRDEVLRVTTRFGLGYMLSQPRVDGSLEQPSALHGSLEQPSALPGSLEQPSALQGGGGGGGGYFSPNPEAFGHPGLGGSIGFADPVARVGFGYVMNLAGMNILVGERPRRLIDALYACLAGQI